VRRRTTSCSAFIYDAPVGVVPGLEHRGRSDCDAPVLQVLM
jgi:hypothetical protein